MKKYSVDDLQDPYDFMYYTWAEPQTANELRKHFWDLEELIKRINELAKEK